MESLTPGLFTLAQQRLEYLSQRQTVLAQNVANTDTPSYVARDLPAFAAALADAAGTMRRTSPRQFAGNDAPAGGAPIGDARHIHPVAQQPDGNAVPLDVELKDIAATASDQQLVTTIYTKYLAMFQLTLGHGNG